MTERVFNFSAGPATLPLSVLQQAQAELPGLLGLPLAQQSAVQWLVAEREAQRQSGCQWEEAEEPAEALDALHAPCAPSLRR